MLVEAEGYRGVGMAVKLSGTPGKPGRRPPRFGEHADSILGEAGCRAEEVAQLRTSGVVHDRPVRS
jgi:crotonobetainyl-CoA:carnitine CoA-transferase CaiB-like acyl-CoA transferase